MAAIVALLTPAAWSYGAALAVPGNVAVSVRSVEWVRDHHGRWLVNDIENFWYNHHKPKKGGVPPKGLLGPAPAKNGANSALAGAQGQPPQHLPAPAGLAPMVANPLPGEGQWHPLGQPVDGVPAMYFTDIRPDTVYTSVVAGVAWMDPTLVRAVLYAGVQEPGGSGWHYEAPVAPADRPNLLAAFNSGFKLKDSEGRYFAEGRTVRPLRDGAATLAIRSDGTPTVGQWGRDLQMGPNIAFARQNLSLIVDGGQPVARHRPGRQRPVGRHPRQQGAGLALRRRGDREWRPGVRRRQRPHRRHSRPGAGPGRRGSGHGARHQLGLGDFFTYGPAAPGQPAANLSVTRLMPDMRSSLDRYLSANSRDFIAIFRR